MLGVNNVFSGSNVGYTLITLNNKLAKEEGFKTAKAAVTGPASQYIFSKLKYETTNSISYKFFSFEGKKIFVGVEKCKGCKLVYKEL